MNQEQFVQHVIKGLVRDTALSVLKQNVGQKTDDPLYPRPLNDAISWYGSLAEGEKVKVLSIAKLAIHSTVFRVLACLDGAKRIDEEDGSLSLYYKRGDGKIVSLLADNDAESLLHDLYMEDFPEWLAQEPSASE